MPSISWMKPAVLVVAICIAALAAPAQGQVPKSFATLPLTFEESSNALTQQQDFYDFMWRSFIALNWPNVHIVTGGPVIVSGFRGEPDMSRSISDTFGAAGTLPLSVWETYKEPFEVFSLPQGEENYPKWNVPRRVPGGAQARRQFRFPIPLAEYATGVNQPYFFPNSTGPLIDQNRNYVRYEVGMNQAFFTYIRHFGYYDGVAQVNAVQNYIRGDRSERAFQRPPFGNPDELGPNGYLRNLPSFARQGMVDVKAAWRPLDPAKGDQTDRYLTRCIIIDDIGTPQTDGSGCPAHSELMGLVALHILRYTPNGYKPGPDGPDGKFVAGTFEHVDNVEITYKPIPGLKPSFNSGATANPQQKKYGFDGGIPGREIQQNPVPTDIYRVTTPLLPGVVAINASYQAFLGSSVFQFYKLIGTQNQHQGQVRFEHSYQRAINGHEGPITGVYTNTNNLINTALESYSQTNFSCILCHVRARPRGVPDKAFEIDHFKILTFLLQAAPLHPQ